MLAIAKFGGSSLSCAAAWRQVREIVTGDIARRVIVVSAAGKRHADDHKITDLLYLCHAHLRYGVPCWELWRKIAGRYLAIRDECAINFPIEDELDAIYENLSPQTSADFLASRGEYMAAKLMAAYLGFSFVDAASWLQFDYAGNVLTDSSYAALSSLADGQKIVTPGFYGALPDGRIHTFPRGGSDITGSLAAAALHADVYENWTDVSGFLMTDPRIVPNPRTISKISYRELRELSYMGASVLHEDSIFPVQKGGIPINVKNTNDPEHPGTMILAEPEDDHGCITGIAGKKGFTIIHLEKDKMNSELGFGRRVLSVFEELGISFEHLPTGIDTLSVVISDKQLNGHKEEVVRRLREVCSPDRIEVVSNLALIATVGHGMVRRVGIAAMLFTALAEAGVNVRMIDQGSSEINIIAGVESDDFEVALRAIYACFENEEEWIE